MLRINLVGRLGNQMYQYCFCRSLANRLGYNFYISDIGKNYHFGNINLKNNETTIFDYFDIDHGEIDGGIIYNFREEDKLLNNLVDITNNNYVNSVTNINDFTLLNGFYENPVYFDMNNIKEWFKFDTEKLNHDYFFKKYNIDDFCVIHFRGGDFKNIDYLYLNDLYYKTAISYFDVNKFIVITDDISSAEKEFKWMRDDNIELYILKNSEIIDIYLLTLSKNLIISNSTFSHFGAFLNNTKGKIIAPYNKNRYYPVDSIRYLDITKKTLI